MLSLMSAEERFLESSLHDVKREAVRYLRTRETDLTHLASCLSWECRTPGTLTMRTSLPISVVWDISGVLHLESEAGEMEIMVNGEEYPRLSPAQVFAYILAKFW